MMSGNPNWWSINSMYPQSHQLSSSPFVIGASSNPSSVDHHHHHNPNQDFPIRSWSQLLLGGHGGAGEEEEEEEEKFESSTLYQLDKKLNHWDNNPHQHRQERTLNLDAKQEQSNYSHHAADDQYNNDHDLLTHHHHHHHHQAKVNSSSSSSSTYCWPINTHHQQVVMPPLVSSPTSCVTSLSNNSSILNFSAGVQNNKPAAALNSGQGKSSNLHHNQDHEQCNNNSSSSGGVAKKARVQQSSAQPALKVRKEKLGDRITALHQLVSPFGKTDTASVLSEAIGYIGFLQGQIEALSSPYMRKGSGRTSHHQQHSVNKQVQGRNNVFHEAHSQVNDDGLVKDLRSRGLCLVPISCTQNMTTTATENGADYWAQPPLGGGGF